MRLKDMLRDSSSWHKRQQMGANRGKTQIKFASSSYSGTDERCGDNCGWIRLHDGKIAVAISDGMGKGEIAAHESERAVNAILPLLKAGMDPEMALQILNLLWSMSNRKELFPTMDLALLDPVGRELTIYKIGAAPTIVIRAPRCGPGQNTAAGAYQKFRHAAGADQKTSHAAGADQKLRHAAGADQKIRHAAGADQKIRHAAGADQKTSHAAGADQKTSHAAGADQKIEYENRPQSAAPGCTDACRYKLNVQASANRIPPERIEILTAPAMPMGVSEYSEIPTISTLIMPGDKIIMMTDGVTDSVHSGPELSDNGEFASASSYPELAWLRRLLMRIKSRNLQTICDLIIREAALNYGDREKDDMTVVIMGL